MIPGIPLAFLALTLPVLQDTRTLDRDDLRLTASSRVRAGAEPVPDRAGDGVLIIEADDVVVDFTGSARLRGSAPDAAPDTYAGIGILVRGKNVTLRNALVSGYRCGIFADGADGLSLEGCDVSDNFRQRLGSKPAHEDADDWLWPHANDGREWLDQYGAGIWIENAHEVTVERCRARDGQNGLVLSRVSDARVYDNDFSYLSGWGIALWRSSDNVITRNACDFCIRGYSHGIYNRGQDSAGILMFEQCSGNVIAENSATHCGDGLFAFAGREALGETEPPTEDFDYRRRGHTRNVIAHNDFSYSAAHGIELTFSFGNWILDNRLVGNAICGIWGGYSRDTVIARNRLAKNGDAGYGLERGGINIEHGSRNRILGNAFQDNACGVHLWWDADAHLATLPWAVANGVASEKNLILRNTFNGDALAIQLRDTTETTLSGNAMNGVGQELEHTPDAAPKVADNVRSAWRAPEYEVLGKRQPRLRQRDPGGRERIVMTEWGPYDWKRPLLQRTRDTGDTHHYRLLGGATLLNARFEEPREDLAVAMNGGLMVSTVRKDALVPYRLEVETSAGPVAVAGMLNTARWGVKIFAVEADPQEDREKWSFESAELASAWSIFTTPELVLPFGSGEWAQAVPANADQIEHEGISRADRFGTLAEMRARFPPGTWSVETRSDDGILLHVDGELLIDDWTVHGPTVHEATFEVPEEREVQVNLQHFERDGYAWLSCRFERLD